MNDLAQQALDAAVKVRERGAATLQARPALWLGVGGFVASAVTVVAGGRVGAAKTVIPLTSWFGLLSAGGFGAADYWPASVTLVGIVALLLLWLAAVAVNRSGRCTERQVWTVASAWALPFVLGPPLLSNDVYTYAAQGVMQHHGYSPYTHGPSVLGAGRVVAAVDPGWRAVGSPYGPLATLVQHLAVAVSGDSALGAVVVLRALAVVSAVAIGLLAADLAGPRRVQALTLTALNPLLLLQVVSAAHLEGIMCALLLGALVAANQRRWALAIVLGCASAAIKVPALMVVLSVVAVHGAGRCPRSALGTVARDLLVAVVSLAVLTLAVPHGLGWLANLDTPALGHSPVAPASLLGDIFSPIVHSASSDDLATGGRISSLLAAGCVVVYLLSTANRRALTHTTGYGLLAIALLSPVLYPWYLLWGIVCLAPAARAAQTDWLVLVSALTCVIMAPDLGRTADVAVASAACLVALAIIGPRVRARYRASQAPIRA